MDKSCTPKCAAGNNPLWPGSPAEEMQDGELHSICCSFSSFHMQWMYTEGWPRSLFLTLQVPWWTIPTIAWWYSPTDGSSLKTSGRRSSPGASLKRYSRSRSCFLLPRIHREGNTITPWDISCFVVSFFPSPFPCSGKSLNPLTQPQVFPACIELGKGYLHLSCLGSLHTLHFFFLSYRWELFPFFPSPRTLFPSSALYQLFTP